MGIIFWAFGIGHIVMFTNVSILSQQKKCSPREGHLAEVDRIFWYLKFNTKKNVGRIIFGIKITYANEGLFIPSDQNNWKELNPESEEAIPVDVTETKGKPVKVSMYIDADHT